MAQNVSLTFLLHSSIPNWDVGEAGSGLPALLLVDVDKGCKASPLLNIFLRPALIEYCGFRLFLSKSRMTAYSSRAVKTRKMQITR